MFETLSIASTILLVIVLLVLLFLLFRGSRSEAFVRLGKELAVLQENAERLERSLRDELARSREEAGSNSSQNRKELSGSLSSFADGLRGQMMDVSSLQKNQLEIFSDEIKHLAQATEQRLDKMRETVEGRLKSLQDENSRKLEQMRVRRGGLMRSCTQRLSNVSANRLSSSANGLSLCTKDWVRCRHLPRVSAI